MRPAKTGRPAASAAGRQRMLLLLCLLPVLLAACGSDHTPPVTVLQVAHGAEVAPFGTDHLADVIYTESVSSKDCAADLPKPLRQESG